MDASNDPSESGPKETLPRKRSRWSISLGGVLVFAAGIMVGFAPMRAWLFLKDEPEHVVIDVILFDANASETERIRRAFAEDPTSDASRMLDPVQILASRTRTHKVHAMPTIMTMVDREARIQIGGERFVPSSDKYGTRSQFFGIQAHFTPSVRPSGKLELQYRIKHASITDDRLGRPIGVDEVGTESTAVVEHGAWRLVEMKSATPSDVEENRSRWLLLRATPVKRNP